jgi:hypothetical protein
METEKNKRQSEIIKKIENKPRLRQNYEIIKLLFKYIKENKKLCFVSFFVVWILFGIFVYFAVNNSVMPLIYALF